MFKTGNFVKVIIEVANNVRAFDFDLTAYSSHISKCILLITTVVDTHKIGYSGHYFVLSLNISYK